MRGLARAMIRKMLKIHVYATKFINDNPQKAARMVAEQLNSPSKVLEASYTRTRFVTGPSARVTLKKKEGIFAGDVTTSVQTPFVLYFLENQ